MVDSAAEFYSSELQIVRVSPPNTDPPVRLLVAFEHLYAALPEWVVQAPGREMWIAASLDREDRVGRVRLYSPDNEMRVSFYLRSARVKQNHLHRPLVRWAWYPAGMLIALNDIGLELPGITAVVVGEEAHGPRYDHALGMAFAALGHELVQRPYSATAIFELAEQVRRDYIEEQG